jgi:DNA helicase-2/ATP-dependent DNA helicase PcrA
MTEEDLLQWLKQQGSLLDSIIVRASREFFEHNKGRSNFGFDLAECQTESWHLKDGEDLCYDRPNTPFCYSLWYHARRVNTFLSHFASEIYSLREAKSIQIFDLGAGTGAVQWALGLIYHKLKSEGISLPILKIINVDTSPFMLHYSKDYLWKHFVLEYSHCQDFSSQIEYHVNSWSNKSNVIITNPWITASYLFDISDAHDKKEEYKKAVLKGFQEIIDVYKPSKILLLTAEAKAHLVNEVSKEFNLKDYTIEHVKSNRLLITGPLSQVNTFRLELKAQYKSELNTFKELSIGNPATWSDVSFIGCIIKKRQVELFASQATSKGLMLHNSAIKIRRDVELNDDQKKAAKPIEQPSVIIGPAGCGKSIVLTERILNIVREANYNVGLSILVTTFNKELLGQLADWITNILKPGSFRLEYDFTSSGSIDRSSRIYFTNSTIANIRLLHFDMLPKILGSVPYWGLVNELQQKAILQSIISEVKSTNGINDSKFDAVLNPEFLLEEYHRVIYGLQVGIQGAKESYLTVSRRGRGIEPQLQRNSDRRNLVWQCLEKFGKRIYNERIPSFTLRRQLFLNKLKSDEVNIKYDYLVVDEFQDCTRADFEIFFNLLKDPNRLVISGDLAQAVHLGRSANIESLREAIRAGRVMNDISWNYLDGSYRLPFRICEAIKRISEHIHLTFRQNHAARILTPYKGAPPGARPIVVLGTNETDTPKLVLEIIKTYQVFQLENLCILEKDVNLHNITNIHTDSVLRLKGLEKQCVIWSTRAGIESSKEAFEFVYTIMSRTACLLIIVLYDDPNNNSNRTQTVFYQSIGLLRVDRLIFWNKEAKSKFSSFCKVIDNEELGEES